MRHWRIINALSTESLGNRILTFKGVLQSARRGLDLSTVIPKGSTVVLLSRFATGNLNLIWSPFGNRSANYELLSIVNEGLTGNGLHYSPWLNIMIWILALICLIAGTMFSQVAAAISVSLIGTVSLVLLSIVTFISFSIQTGWASPAIGLLVSGVYLTMDKALRHYVKSQLLERALVGVVSAEQISRIRLDSRVLGVEPVEKNVSIL
jgi:hypothetical protein